MDTEENHKVKYSSSFTRQQNCDKKNTGQVGNLGFFPSKYYINDFYVTHANSKIKEEIATTE